MAEKFKRIYQPYKVFFFIYGAFFIMAFMIDAPSQLWHGLVQIITSRSILITDYIGVGGIGATFLNVVIVGCISLVMLIRAGVKPNGATIMALWLTTGFAFFGKNIFNMMPITFGVWLYARFQKEPFRNFSLVALLSATISPIVSEVTFLGVWDKYLAMLAGVLLGIIAGFIFPAVAAFCVRVHDGYDLYNMGFAGGLLSSFFLAFLQSIGIEVEPMLIWSTGNNLVLGIVLYLLAAALIMIGLVLGTPEHAWKNLQQMTQHPGRLATDFYAMFGQNSYINMGLMCLLTTTLVLVLGADLNGPTISGILTAVGFGCFGKHLKNVIPLFIGAILSTYVNMWDVTWPSNILAILFSAGLAPIAGHFGGVWGIIAGFLHVTFVIHIRFLNSGMNLYNNGFGAGFVALLLVPIISALRKERRIKK